MSPAGKKSKLKGSTDRTPAQATLVSLTKTGTWLLLVAKQKRYI